MTVRALVLLVAVLSAINAFAVDRVGDVTELHYLLTTIPRELNEALHKAQRFQIQGSVAEARNHVNPDDFEVEREGQDARHLPFVIFKAKKDVRIKDLSIPVRYRLEISQFGEPAETQVEVTLVAEIHKTFKRLRAELDGDSNVFGQLVDLGYLRKALKHESIERVEMEYGEWTWFSFPGSISGYRLLFFFPPASGITAKEYYAENLDILESSKNGGIGQIMGRRKRLLFWTYDQ